MKLLYIHQYFSFPEDHDGTRSYDLATSFTKNGINVTVLTSSTNNEKSIQRWSSYNRDGITFYAINCPYSNLMSFTQRVLSFVRFMFFSSIKALQIKADIVLATSTPLTIAVPAILKRILQKTPFVFEVRDVWPEIPIKMGIITNYFAKWGLRKFEIYTYKKASWVVPLSIGMYTNIQKRYNTNNKFTVIPNISEINRFCKNKNKPAYLNLPNLNNKKVVLYCGTVGIVNGLKYIVDLAKYTKDIDNNIYYLIFGKGNELKDVIEYAKISSTLSVNVFFFNTVAKETLPYLYSLASVGSSFVTNIPILWDNSANKFFDTLAASKPIIINHLGWQADCIKQNNCGYILPISITAKESKKFVNYINDYNLLKEQSQNAFYIAKNEYSLEIATNKYISIFNKVLS